MDFRNTIIISLLFVVWFVSSNLARNLDKNYALSANELACDNTTSETVLETLRNVTQRKAKSDRVLIVLTDSENDIYPPLKEELSKRRARFLPLHVILKKNIKQIYKNVLFLQSVRYLKFVIHAQSVEKAADIFQEFASIFQDISQLSNSIGIALTLNNDTKKENVVAKLYNAAKKLNKPDVLQLVDHYLFENGPPIAIFNNHSSNNPPVDTFIDDIYYYSRTEDEDNFKFIFNGHFQKMINCTTLFAQQQVLDDVKRFVRRRLKTHFDILKQPINDNLSAVQKDEAYTNLAKSYNYLLRISREMDNVKNPKSFLRTLRETFKYTKFETAFDDNFFLPRNIDIIQFLYMTSDYAFTSALEEWTKPLKDFKLPNLDKMNQWYQKEEGGFLFSRNFETKCLDLPKGKKLQVKGTIVSLSEIDVSQCPEGVKFLEVFALEKVSINMNLTFVGMEMQVAIIAPVWDVVGFVEINLNGVSAKDMDDPATNGNKTGNKNGADGLAGMPGGPAGNFYGVANQIINGEQLNILAIGGNGGKGQDGGHGADGEDGVALKDKETFDCWTQTASVWNVEKYGNHNVTHNVYSNNGDKLIHQFYLVNGTDGTRGGRGGNGGARGLGGYGGRIVLFDLSKNDGQSSGRIAALDGNSGDEGRGVSSGQGGRQGTTMKVKCTHHRTDMFTKLQEFLVFSEDTIRATSGPSGTDGKSLKMRRMPKTVPIVQNFPQTMNEYKNYARPQLLNATDMQLLSFYESLNTRKEISDLYDTVSLVEEYTGLELQDFQSHDHLNLTSSYVALQKRINNYLKKANFKQEKVQEYQVIQHFSSDIAAKIEQISRRKEYSVMADIMKGFSILKQKKIIKLKEQENVKSTLATLSKMIDPVNDLIEEAEQLIKDDLQTAMRDIQSTLDQEIDSLLQEISELKKKSNGKEDELIESRKKLQNMIVLKNVFGLLKIGCGLVGVVNPALGVVATVASSTLTVLETHLTKTDFSATVAEVPKAVKALSSAAEVFVKNEKPNKDAEMEFDVTYISEMKRNATKYGKKMIDRVWNNVKGALGKSKEQSTSLKSQNREEVYKAEEEEITRNKVEATKNNDVNKINDCKLSLNVLKFLKVNNEVLQTVSDTVTNIMKDEEKIDELDKALKETRENLKKLHIAEEQVYTDTQPMLGKMLDFMDQVGQNMGSMSKNKLIIADWNVINTIENVQHTLKDSLEGYDVTQEMEWTLDKLSKTFTVMSKMHKQILKYVEKKSQNEYMAMLHLPSVRELLTMDSHLTNALASLKTAILYNSVRESYEEWVFAFKQFAFPYGGDIMKKMEQPDASVNRTIDSVIRVIKRNIGKFEEHLDNESMFVEISKNKRRKDFMGSASSDERSFFVWGNNDIRDILSGNESKIVAHSPIRGFDCLKFNQVGLHFTSRDRPEIEEKLMKVLKKFTVRLTHNGDSMYRFQNRVFEIKTRPIELIFEFPKTPDQVVSSATELYERIAKGNYMLSPYATWTIKLIAQDPNDFQRLEEFIGQVELELIGKGQFVEDSQCNRECKDTMRKYYKYSYDIHDL